jgi:hypothetical protein
MVLDSDDRSPATGERSLSDSTIQPRRTNSQLGRVLPVALFAVLLALVDTFATFVGWVCPTGLFVVVAAAVVAVTVFSVRPLGPALATLTGVLALAFFAALFLWPMTPRKLFFRDMQRIATGMTRSEVRALASRWRPGTPRWLASGLFDETPPDCDVFHHGEGGDLLSSDHCRVRYDGDVVSLVEFIYD